jgi:hypothetical protein
MADEAENQRDETLRLNIDWDTGEDAPVQPANVGLVQVADPEVVLTFAHTAPPIAMAFLSPAQVAEYVQNHSIPVRHVVRLVVPIGIARHLTQNLAHQLFGVDLRRETDEPS